MGAEVSGSLRRTPSRPPRSALGLDGVGAPRLAPAARLVSRAVSVGGRSNLRDCVVPIAISRRKEAASSGQIFGTLSKAENLQRAFAGGGKGLARAAARPALAKNVKNVYRKAVHQNNENSTIHFIYMRTKNILKVAN